MTNSEKAAERHFRSKCTFFNSGKNVSPWNRLELFTELRIINILYSLIRRRERNRMRPSQSLCKYV